ncbi:MAG: hypothetical protein WC423_13925 [Vulcanimicrobiota bacterium]
MEVAKDSTIIIREPHQNEGANPRLHLKKVTGKPAQVVVGFDTSGLDTTGLTKASLVLNIDSTQNVTGWGNGRPIRAQRLLTAWTEGNGKKLGLPGNQQSSGSGNGVTWFSPIDGNIANSQADSAVNWNGGASYAAPSTAPTVTIKNHQSGEVIFDVTQDLLNGANHGWLITRDQDVGSQVTFLSKESGDPELAPRLGPVDIQPSVTKLVHFPPPEAKFSSNRSTIPQKIPLQEEKNVLRLARNAKCPQALAQCLVWLPGRPIGPG